MDMLYTLFATLIALGLLVTVHEWGHFWVARRCGVRVLRFSVGFGTPLVRWYDRQGTEFVIAAIPLGGYVRMLDEREAPVQPELLNQAFNRKSVAQRFSIVAAGPLVNFALAVVLFWVLALMGSQQVKPIIGGLAAGSLAEQAGLQIGQELIAVDGKAVTSWGAVNLRLVERLGETGTLVIKVLDSNAREWDYQIKLNAWLRNVEEPDPLEQLGLIPWRPAVEPVIAELDAQGPAQQAGVQLGDRVLRLNDQPIEGWYQLVQQVQSLPGRRIELHLDRAGQQLTIPLTLDKRDDGRGYLGAGAQPVDWPQDMLRELNFGPLEAVAEAVRRTWSMSVLTLDSLKKMLLGELSVKNLSGPITIAKVAGASAQSGLGSFLNFLAYLSISLGVLNLLPIPVLDGGHLLFYAIEGVRGRPLSDRVQGWGMQIGIGLMFGLMLLALFNDIGRL
ncbi:regulator of sigma E protease [Azomonas agilis]|uniref:Zinc metalloprotease n=1 Tax=Azomonas agilis TaxID=116849 RepID=A0A562I1X6_9GAMM|nr:RIP metalloprotease RseP [Azomonas agilis]TWH64704.1 regulator of sigma E protease [Azomonas agilis]